VGKAFPNLWVFKKAEHWVRKGEENQKRGRREGFEKKGEMGTVGKKHIRQPRYIRST